MFKYRSSLIIWPPDQRDSDENMQRPRPRSNETFTANSNYLTGTKMSLLRPHSAEAETRNNKDGFSNYEQCNRSNSVDDRPCSLDSSPSRCIPTNSNDRALSLDSGQSRYRPNNYNEIERGNSSSKNLKEKCLIKSNSESEKKCRPKPILFEKDDLEEITDEIAKYSCQTHTSKSNSLLMEENDSKNNHVELKDSQHKKVNNNNDISDKRYCIYKSRSEEPEKISFPLTNVKYRSLERPSSLPYHFQNDSEANHKNRLGQANFRNSLSPGLNRPRSRDSRSSIMFEDAATNNNNQSVSDLLNCGAGGDLADEIYNYILMNSCHEEDDFFTELFHDSLFKRIPNDQPSSITCSLENVTDKDFTELSGSNVIFSDEQTAKPRPNLYRSKSAISSNSGLTKYQSDIRTLPANLSSQSDCKDIFNKTSSVSSRVKEYVDKMEANNKPKATNKEYNYCGMSGCIPSNSELDASPDLKRSIYR